MSDRVCIRCGGSWNGAEFDTLCAHDFDEAPEPDAVELMAPERATTTEAGETFSKGERYWFASGSAVPSQVHPTREGAIAAWKAAWRERIVLTRAALDRFSADFTKAAEVQGCITAATTLAEMIADMTKIAEEYERAEKFEPRARSYGVVDEGSRLAAFALRGHPPRPRYHYVINLPQDLCPSRRAVIEADPPLQVGARVRVVNDESSMCGWSGRVTSGLGRDRLVKFDAEFSDGAGLVSETYFRVDELEPIGAG
jgi:hypothetical protein